MHNYSGLLSQHLTTPILLARHITMLFDDKVIFYFSTPPFVLIVPPRNNLCSVYRRER